MVPHYQQKKEENNLNDLHIIYYLNKKQQKTMTNTEGYAKPSYGREDQ